MTSRSNEPDHGPGAGLPIGENPSRWEVFVWTYRANIATLPWLARVLNAVIDAILIKRGR